MARFLNDVNENKGARNREGRSYVVPAMHYMVVVFLYLPVSIMIHSYLKNQSKHQLRVTNATEN
ncbi:hypothetical protein L484_007699 [Morus notabilis]|uniref:Uncharacterized protein n=1 Tax=Morus notabilis TaxID=981085 RepID=W9SLX0_9ROSA|nr:hypothetical protein L484_007699 [Morus notabilis]